MTADLFADADEPVDVDDLADAASSVPRQQRVDSKGRHWTRHKCRTCGRFYEVGYKVSKGPPVERCCGSKYCDAVQHWTDEEWALRAERVRHTSPPGPWSLLRHLANSECTWCNRPLGIYVLPPGGGVGVDGWRAHHDRVVACVGCGRVVHTFEHTPSSSDLIDAEALRRFPNVDAAA